MFPQVVRTNLLNYVETWFNLSTEKPLENVEFTLKAREDILDPCTGEIVHPKGTIIGVVTTHSNGIAEFNNLLFGKYTLSETKTPNGYVAKGDIDITINSSSKEIKLDISNDNETIVINIKKTGEKQQDFDSVKDDIVYNLGYEKETIVSIEPNPAIYGTNFINYTNLCTM